VLHDYGPFGETLPDWTPVLTWDADPVMYGYSGRQYDRESGLYYNRARNYSPSLGRWLSKDPLFGSAGADVNPYRFVFNDPAVEIDPSGDCGLQLGAVLSGGAGAGWTVEGGVAVAYNPNTGIITVAFYGTAGTGSYAGTGGSLTGQVTVTPAANSTSDLNGPSVETNGSGTVGGYTAGGGVSVSSNGNVGYSVSGGIGTGTQYSSSTNITGTITSSPLTIPTGLGTNANTNTPSNLNTSSNTTSQAPIPWYASMKINVCIILTYFAVLLITVFSFFAFTIFGIFVTKQLENCLRDLVPERWKEVTLMPGESCDPEAGFGTPKRLRQVRYIFSTEDSENDKIWQIKKRARKVRLFQVSLFLLFITEILGFFVFSSFLGSGF
jgi:RHS repeat-associated protein